MCGVMLFGLVCLLLTANALRGYGLWVCTLLCALGFRGLEGCCILLLWRFALWFRVAVACFVFCMSVVVYVRLWYWFRGRPRALLSGFVRVSSTGVQVVRGGCAGVVVWGLLGSAMGLV